MSDSIVTIDKDKFVVINWEEAMSQVSDDVEFLQEVLTDLIDEAVTAQNELKIHIEGKHFENVMKAAHRVKGSASYLCVDRMREISLHMQLYGHAGKDYELDPNSLSKHAANLKVLPNNTEHIWMILSSLFGEFQLSVDDLKLSISQRFPEQTE